MVKRNFKYFIHILLYCVIILLYVLSLTLGKWVRYDYKKSDLDMNFTFDLFKLCLNGKFNVINFLRNQQINIQGSQQYILPSNVEISTKDEEEINAISSIELCFELNNIKVEVIRDDLVEKGANIIVLLNKAIENNYGLINKYIPNTIITHLIDDIKTRVSNEIYKAIDNIFNQQDRNIDTYTTQNVKSGIIKPELTKHLDLISKVFKYLQYAIIGSVILLFCHVLLVVFKGKTSIFSGLVTVLIPLICLLTMTVFYFIITFHPKLKKESRQLITSSYMLYIFASIILLITLILSIIRII